MPLAGCLDAPPIRVAIHPWIGYETLPLAQQLGWLPASVQLTETRDLGDSAKALQTGRVDAACVTLDEVLRLRAAGMAVTVVLVFDVSAGADVVMARPEIDSLAKLAGRRIGFEGGPLSTIILNKLLKEIGGDRSTLRIAKVPPESQLEAWRQGTLDAVITYEPNATLLQREGAHRLFDSRNIPDIIMDVLAVRADLLESRRRALRDLAKAHFRGLGHLQTNRQDALHRIATRQGVTFEEISIALQGVMLPSESANREYLAGAQPRLLPVARELSEVMVGAGLLAKMDDMAELANAGALPAVAERRD